jgi:hypothetical protein
LAEQADAHHGLPRMTNDVDQMSPWHISKHYLAPLHNILNIQNAGDDSDPPRRHIIGIYYRNNFSADYSLKDGYVQALAMSAISSI